MRQFVLRERSFNNKVEWGFVHAIQKLESQTIFIYYYNFLNWIAKCLGINVLILVLKRWKALYSLAAPV